MPSDTILDVQEVSKSYEVRVSLLKKQKVRAIHQVSFSIKKGSTLALVGGSGSGKSTLARIIMRLEPSTSGKILIDSQPSKKNINHISSKEYYKRVQMVFQDPYTSLNTRKKIWQIISAPLATKGFYNKGELFAAAEKYSQLVGLGLDCLHAYPRALSGGQRQRVGIARALVLEPELLILDEALSALDLSIQAQIINLLVDLQTRLGLTYLFISNDIQMVAHFADQVAVMLAGEIVEIGNVSDIFNHPSHPYTGQLVGEKLS